MPLPDETLLEIDTLVRSGFEPRDRVIESFREEMYAEGDLDVDEIIAAVDPAIQRHEQSKTEWPAVTDCDRPTAGFPGLGGIRDGLR